MTSEQWQRVKAVVAEALAAEPSARDELVARACGADETLRREVRSLLASIDLAADRFEGPLIDTPGAGAALRALIDGESADAGADTMIGRRIGPYEIRRELGRGGMGAVYLASRIDEFTQEVALKIIKRGMDTDAIVRRFRTERQILAGLDHPNIARLLDGGTTPDGLPYIVMEYVDGEPITTVLRRPHDRHRRAPGAPSLRRRCRRLRAPASRHSPGHQAVERSGHPRRAAEAARLRIGDGADAGPAPRHQHRGRVDDARLRVARAGQRRPGDDGD